MLFGEYGVLEGGCALLIAVNRRAKVTLTPAKHYAVAAPGWLAKEEALFDLHPEKTTPIWHQPSDGESLGLVNTVLSGLSGSPATPVKLTLDTRALFGEQGKFGIGSSAALCVALAAAWSRCLDKTLTLADCQTLHFDFQGSGSGADIATCYQGGVVHFRRHQSPVPALLPQGLQLAFIWTGLSASTSRMLQTLATYKDECPKAYQRIMVTLQNSAEHALGQSGLVEAWLAAVADFVVALRAFAGQTSLPIFHSPHEELFRLAGNQGLLYKPMGAGGGDLGLAASDDKSQLETFCRTVTERGLKTLQFEIDPQGLWVGTDETARLRAGGFEGS